MPELGGELKAGAVPVGAFHKSRGGLSIGGQRLFTENRDALIEANLGQRLVLVGRSADPNSVEFHGCEHLGRVGEYRQPFLGSRRAGAGIRVASRDYFRAFQGVPRLHVDRANSAQADNPYLEFL